MPGGIRRHGAAFLSPGKSSMINVVPRLHLMHRGPSILFSTGEAQSGQQARQVIDVVAHAVALFDQLGNPWTGPEVSCESIGLGTLEQSPVQTSSLAYGQSGRLPRGGLGEKAGISSATVCGAPSADAAGIDLET